MPLIPPTTCTAKTSRLSSILSFILIKLTAKYQINPPDKPIIIAPPGPRTPAAGVTVARPAIVPVAAPTRVGFLLVIASIATQTKVATEADICVTNIAIPAPPSAES